MDELLKKAGLNPDVLKDPAKRTAAVDEYNAKAGGLRSLMRGGKLEPAATHPIQQGISKPEVLEYLKFVAAGKRVPIIFAAGRATRMKLPKAFDSLGLAGLTPNILSELNSLREGEEAPPKKIESSSKLKEMLSAGTNGETEIPEDLSFIQRQLLQLRYQTEKLIRENPKAGVSLEDWLKNAKFAVVANEENRSAVALQLAGIRFAGLRPEHVYLVIQPEEGGLEVLPDGLTKPYSKDVWPEGHGKPFIDMRTDPKAAVCLNARGHLVPLNRTFVQELTDRGAERVVFAQVNDLHLLEDMTHLERWLASDGLIQNGADMVMEMVENGLKQKGGGIFVSSNGSVVMRDTIAMKSPDLEAYSVPRSLSRMFYELTVKGISTLTAEALPEYLTERRTLSGKCVLTREYYSGDASSVLRGQAIQEKGYALETFKTQSRIPAALGWMRRQDSQPGFGLKFI